MSIAIRRQIMMLALSTLCGLASYQPAWAVRNQDYNAEQFVSVLNGLGYPVALGTPLSDPKVQQAIREFQIQYKLPVDGSLNFSSQDHAADMIRNLQRNLNLVLKLKSPLPLTQFYGPQTEAAVKLFQQQNHLPATGIATGETRQKLAALVSLLLPATVGVAPQAAQRPPDDPNAKPVAKPQLPSTSSTTTLAPGAVYLEAEFRSLLQNLGYDIDLAQPLSDIPTQMAIRDFQKTYGLVVNGQADQPTQERAATIVRNLRNNLRTVLNPNFPVTASYDSETIAAVKQFQANIGARVDGIATLSVRKKLDAEAKRIIGQ